MGLFKLLFGGFFGSKKVRVLTVGLDNSGKTTIIEHLKPKKATSDEVVPTVGFRVEQFKKNNVEFTVFDMSGHGRYRNLWEHYYKEAQAVIFVIDSKDEIRFSVVADELSVMLQHKDIVGRNIPILFFANKMDIPGSSKPDEIIRRLELNRILGDRNFHIQQSNGLTGEGIEEGAKWLIQNIIE